MITPKLDKNFYPMIKAMKDFEKRVNAEKPENTTTITLVVERNGGYNYVHSYKGLKDGVDDTVNYRIAERLIKSILWVCGGYKIDIAGSKYIYETLKKSYSKQSI